MMAVLASGVPLSLLVDMAIADGPDSAHIFRREVADMSWLTGLSTGLDSSERPAAAM
jgi:hypothetical protein